MRKRRGYLLLIAIGVLVGVLAVKVEPEREPEYGGRKLSEWVERYKYWHGYGPEGHEAAIAIDAIGMKAFPYLLKWATYRQPAWKRELYHTLDLTDKRIARSAQAAFALPILRSPAVPPLLKAMNDDPWNFKIVDCFGSLGSDAEDAIPALQKALTHPEPRVRSAATNSLLKINPQALFEGNKRRD